MTVTLIIVSILRVVGLVWGIGGVFIMRNARQLGDSDVARWLFVGGALTFVAGVLLAAGSKWAAIPAVAVAVQQAVFHWRQVRELPPGVPRPSPTPVRVAVVVAVATVIAAAKGALV